MVKRLLSIVAIALTAVVGVQAQTLQVNPEGAANGFAPSVNKVSAAITSLDGAEEWGYTNSAPSTWQGVGVNQAGVAFGTAIFVPGDGVLGGAKISGVNIPVIDTAGTGYTAWVKTNLDDETPLASAEAATPYAYGYNAVEFDSPVEIPAEGLYVGYSFTCSLPYPVAFDSGQKIERTLYLQFSGGAWGDYGTQFGASPLKIFLADLTLPDNFLTMQPLEGISTAFSSPFTADIAVTSNAQKAVESVDYTITVAGESESKHFVFDTPIPAGLGMTGVLTVEGTSPAEIGEYTVSVVIDKVNGEDNSEAASTEATFKNLTKIVPRYTVVEEFTGTGCPWCTRGWAGMEMMKHGRENFIGIAFHKYNNSDPMYLANYPMLGLTGAPGCVMDRKLSTDPYFGTGRGDDILADFDFYNAKAPEVDITVTGAYNEDSTSVVVNAATEFLIKPGKVSFVYVLTADGLSGTTSAWRQANNYAGYTPGGLPYLDDFCSGGKYGSTYVYLTFDDVMIGSSYNASLTNQGTSVEGGSRLKEGSVYNTEYTIPMPTKATLKEAIDKDQVYAVVLVLNDATGEILNAAKVKVTGTPTAISTLKAETAAEAYYSIDGRRLTTPQKGMNIIRRADGTTQKVVVE